MIGRSISIIPSVPADDHCNICTTQLRQLICLLHQIRFPSEELLRNAYCEVAASIKAETGYGK